ncbi:hypothetical protein AXF42_Ash019568 [Apostasia shenzhenica]|uniref:Uncharacterized protein n=1 Tax=Apostasia shenzhenica TaxID=1088818 RepID=A0A2I0AV35_9ASPA|nr:hypothetical protein AXF42_Ash019568 [Apostasia shenzhenica]
MEGLPWSRKKFSFRNATIVVCFLNAVTAAILIRGIFSYGSRRGGQAKQPNLELVRYMMESEQIRKSMEPVNLIKRIKEIQAAAYTEQDKETKQVPKQTAAVDLSKRLKDMRTFNDANSLKALEEWRKRKMERARQREIEKNATIKAQT